METFGNRVKAARKELGLTQTDLAKAAGLSQTTISDIERGRNFSSSEIVALSKALKMTSEELVDGVKPPQPHPTTHKEGQIDAPQNSASAAEELALAAYRVAEQWLQLPASHRELFAKRLNSELQRLNPHKYVRNDAASLQATPDYRGSARPFSGEPPQGGSIKKKTASSKPAEGK